MNNFEFILYDWFLWVSNRLIILVLKKKTSILMFKCLLKLNMYHKVIKKRFTLSPLLIYEIS